MRDPALAAVEPSRPGWLATSVGLVLLVLVGLVGLLLGAAGINAGDAVRAFVDLLPFVEVEHGLTVVQESVLFEIRAPRVVLGGLVGATLAVAGASYQGVFRNPLADPFLLGVAAGAGLGATIAFAISGEVGLLAPFAFVGGMAAVAITYALGRSVGGRTTTSLILAGVAVAAFATAVQTFVLQRNSETLRQVYSWILGQLVTVGWADVATLLPYALVAALVMLLGRRLLDVLSIGDEEASALGINVPRFRWVIVVAATLATAAAVSVAGLIGFVGIIVPHTIRLLFGTSYRVIVPLSILFGASFLMGADIIARTIIAPAELPIGVVTAFLGAPFFVLVLRSMGRDT